MKKLIYILFLLPFLVQAQNYDRYVTKKRDTIFTKIIFSNFENSSRYIEVYQGDSVVKIYANALLSYQRGKDKFVSGKYESPKLDSNLFYKIEENGEHFKLFSTYKSAQQHYILFDKKTGEYKEVDLKYFEKSLAKKFRKNKSLSARLKNKELCFEHLTGVIREANSPNAIVETSADIYKNPVKKIPIYTGHDAVESTFQERLEQLLNNLDGESSPSAEKNQKKENKNEDDEDDTEEEIPLTGAGGEKSRTRNPFSFNNKILFFNGGLHTGFAGLNSTYFNKTIPYGLNIGADLEFAFFQPYWWVGVNFEKSFFPYLNKGNLMYNAYGFHSRIYLFRYVFLMGSYDFNNIMYSMYPLSKSDQCDCIEDDQGIKNYGKTLGAVNLFNSKTASYTLGIGLHGRGDFHWWIFNDFQLQFSNVPTQFVGNTTNINFVQSTGVNVAPIAPERMWMIGLKVGIRVWVE